jgi:hypothetical protein
MTSRLRRYGAPVLLCAMLATGAGGLAWMTGACAPTSTTPDPSPTSAALKSATPAAPAELEAQLTRDIAHLSVTIGERHGAGHEAALEQAADWIEAQVAAMGWTVVREEYEVDGQPFRNLYVEIKGEGAPDELVVIGAHYDSAQGTPGADDNATGVAALLYMARALHGAKPARTLRLVWFTNEEPPHFKTASMGSLVHAQRAKQRGERVVAMVSLEMLGFYSVERGVQTYPMGLGAVYPAHGDYIAVVGNVGSNALVHEVAGGLRAGSDMQVETLAAPEALAEISFSDQWSFWQQGWPGVMVTDTGFLRNRHYHEVTDTPEVLDVARMARLTRALPGLALRLSEVAAPR